MFQYNGDYRLKIGHVQRFHVNRHIGPNILLIMAEIADQKVKFITRMKNKTR